MVNGGLFSLSFRCFQNAIEDPIGVLELGIPENISPWLKGLPMPVNSTLDASRGFLRYLVPSLSFPSVSVKAF